MQITVRQLREMIDDQLVEQMLFEADLRTSARMTSESSYRPPAGKRHPLQKQQGLGSGFKRAIGAGLVGAAMMGGIGAASSGGSKAEQQQLAADTGESLEKYAFAQGREAAMMGSEQSLAMREFMSTAMMTRMQQDQIARMKAAWQEGWTAAQGER